MQIYHTGRAASFEKVPRGAAFRFMHRGKWLIALKVVLQDTEGGLVLTEGSADLPPGSGFRPERMDALTVLELKDTALVPSSDERAMTLRIGQVAEPGELELIDDKVLFTIPTAHRANRRVDIATGEVSDASGSLPVTVTEWSLVQQVAGRLVTIYTRKPPSAGGISVE
jgi:hypothetical protein